MRIGRHTNGLTCELQMQADFIDWLQGDHLKRYNVEFVDEFRVPEVQRIADFLLWKPKQGLINVEAKGNVTGTLYNQMRDHAKYCNYSFAYIPDYTIVPMWFKKALYEHRWGLIIYNYRTRGITEAIEAHHNICIDQKLNKKIRKRMIEKLNNS